MVAGPAMADRKVLAVARAIEGALQPLQSPQAQ
jgi:Asp-tRNA(Asn)/Glu-tRNA(Gln) amidotransferase A subunit family amidase